MRAASAPSAAAAPRKGEAAKEERVAKARKKRTRQDATSLAANPEVPAAAPQMSEGEEGAAASKLPASRRELLQAALQRHLASFPAVAIALVDRDGLVHADAAGSVDGSPASPSTTIFPTASISKTIVAALCLQCAERGELQLDEDVNRYLPERSYPADCSLRNPNFPDAAITVRQLLTHRSSLIDDESALLPGRWRTEGEDCTVCLAEYVFLRLYSKSPDFEPWLWSKEAPPGEAAYHYSNAGFSVLGLVLETVTGRGPGGVDALAKERLFAPLGMQRSSFLLAPLLQLPGVVVAAPHGKHHWGPCEYTAASLRSTALDVGRWMAAVIAGLLGGPMPNGALSQESLMQMLPPGKVCKTGLAWWGVDAAYGNRRGNTWEHGGFMDGVRSHMYVWPKSSVGAVILMNGEGTYDALAYEIRAALAEHAGIALKEL